MNAFLDSLKSDLLDRRVAPLLGLLAAALLGALAYAVLAGGSGSPAQPARSASVVTPSTAGIAVSAVQSDTKSSASETTSGAAEQTGGASRNPFAPTPGAQPAKAASTSSEESSSAGGSGAATTSAPESSSTGGGSDESPSQNSGSQQQEKQPAKKVYKVSVLFGAATPGTPPLSAGLTSYENLKRQQPLPSAKQPVIVFRGVVVGAKSATFTLVGEAIPRGQGVCKPSAEQCQAIDLKVGQTEELEYVPLGGTPANYELQLVSIEALNAGANGSGKTASVATVARVGAYGGESRAGAKLLRREGLTELPGLRYSRDGSVLVFVASDHALAARAHASAWGATARG